MASDADTAAQFTTHADPMDRDVTSPAGLGPIGWGRWFWRRLTSMRTALVLLLLLGLAAIPGSLVPQRTSDAMAVNRFTQDNPQLSQWYERFGLFDVYGSPWFSAIYLLLFVSLVGCLVPRALQHWRLWRASPTPPPRSLKRLPAVTSFDGDAQPALDAAEADLRAGRWRVRRGSDWVAGEKGFIRETGNQIFHFAMLGVLASIGWGALSGWHGTVMLREGTGFADTVTQYDTFTAGRFASAEALPPFTVQLQSFDVDFERGEAQRGAPRDFDARALVTDSDGQQQLEQFSVNAPLAVDGAKVYLLGHGYAPRVTVRDGDGNVVVDDSVVFLPQDGNFTSEGVIKAPDAQPEQLGFRGIFLPTAAIDPVTGPTSTFPAPDDPALFLSAFSGDLGLDDGAPQNVYQLDDTDMKQLGLQPLRVGESWKLPGGAGSVTFTGIDRYVSLKVAHDPGGAWALGFVGVAIAGVCLSLFVRRRRVWVVAQDGTVTVAGVARGEGDVDTDVAALADAVRQDPSCAATSSGGTTDA